MKKLKKARLRKLLFLASKIGMGSAAAILIAEFFSLDSPTAAGTIALLTLSSTRTQTLRLIVQRYATYIVSFLLIWGLFSLFQSEYLAYAVFLVIIVFILELTGTMATLSVNAMIALHASSSVVNMDFFFNELWLLTIGVAIAFLFSYLHPFASHQGELKEAVQNLDAKTRLIMLQLAKVLQGSAKADEAGMEAYWQYLESTIQTAQHWMRHAREYRENAVHEERRVYEKVITMRVEQLSVLHSLRMQKPLVETRLAQRSTLVSLVEEIADQCLEPDVPEDLWEKIEQIRIEVFDIGQERGEELEDRFSEYQILMDLKEFLMLKKDLNEQLSEKEKKLYLQLFEASSRKNALFA